MLKADFCKGKASFHLTHLMSIMGVRHMLEGSDYKYQDTVDLL